MPNETDLEQLARLCGVRVEDLSEGNIMKFQGSLTGISKLSPLNLKNVQPPVNQKSEKNEPSNKEK